MPARLLSFAALVLAASLAVPTTAWGSDGAGYDGHTAVSPSRGKVKVSVKASTTPTTRPPLAGQSNAVTTVPPGQPYGCTFAPLSTAAQVLLGVGGPEPGQWESEICKGPGVVNPLPAVWVTTGQSRAPVNPGALELQASSQLVLPTPEVQMAPPDGAEQLVGVPTWLWLPASSWKTTSVTASAGPVSATVTAVPDEVVWDMGDGDSLTCDGPGTPYDPAAPDATTGCSYTWPEAGTYRVTSTIYWAVSWTAAGAPGGGDLGLRAGPSAQLTVEVTESQAINTPVTGTD